MIYIGIDPGLSGGIAMIQDDGLMVWCGKMPATEADLLTALRPVDAGKSKALIEKVHASPQMGVTSAFTFGRGYGGLRMALAALGLPFDEVTPQRWQKVMGCLTRGDKNVSKRRAQDLFPDVTVTHAIADALLIAEYGRRFHKGMVI